MSSKLTSLAFSLRTKPSAVTSNTAYSVTIICTHRFPVSGRVHFFKILLLPSFAICCMATMTRLAPTPMSQIRLSRVTPGLMRFDWDTIDPFPTFESGISSISFDSNFSLEDVRNTIYSLLFDEYDVILIELEMYVFERNILIAACFYPHSSL